MQEEKAKAEEETKAEENKEEPKSNNLWNKRLFDKDWNEDSEDDEEGDEEIGVSQPSYVSFPNSEPKNNSLRIRNDRDAEQAKQV